MSQRKITKKSIMSLCLTSLSKFCRVNSSELRRAWVAASLTLLLGSSFFMPNMMPVRMWSDWAARMFGS